MSALVNTRSSALSSGTIAERIQRLDWACLSQDLDGQGSAIVEGLLSSNECEQLTGLYVRDELFRSRVVMDHHGFGRGEYKYFAYPLPDIIYHREPPGRLLSLSGPHG